jgi:translation initiation factor IF-3
VAFRRRRWRDARPDEDKVRINHAIRVPEVRVVNEDGQQLGVMPTKGALEIAGRIGLDLVEIAANADPPVCKIMDYGRFKFEAKKKAATAKKAQHQSQLKEIKFRPRIDEHDLDYKLRNARKFLFAGDKVKCTVMFRGREIVHAHLGRELLETVEQRLGDIAISEGRPSMEGRMLSVVYAPNRQAIDKLRAEQAREEDMETEEYVEDSADDDDLEDASSDDTGEEHA